MIETIVNSLGDTGAHIRDAMSGSTRVIHFTEGNQHPRSYFVGYKGSEPIDGGERLEFQKKRGRHKIERHEVDLQSTVGDYYRIQKITRYRPGREPDCVRTYAHILNTS